MKVDPSDTYQIIILLILLALSAFFSSNETALMSVNKIRLRSLADEGNKRAAMALDILENQTPKLLSAILIGNNIVNISASSLATTLAYSFGGYMDSEFFLGGSEPTTLKDLAEALGKETIDSYNNSDTRGNSPSYGTNYQKIGHELMSRDELAVLDGGKCILQLRGVRPFLSDKYDLTQHPNYKYTSDYDPKNALDIEKFLKRKEKIHPDDTFIMVDADSLPPA